MIPLPIGIKEFSPVTVMLFLIVFLWALGNPAFASILTVDAQRDYN